MISDVIQIFPDIDSTELSQTLSLPLNQNETPPPPHQKNAARTKHANNIFAQRKLNFSERSVLIKAICLIKVGCCNELESIN